jgi:uncharacterized protein
MDHRSGSASTGVVRIPRFGIPSFALVLIFGGLLATAGCLGRSPQVRFFMLGVMPGVMPGSESGEAVQDGAPDVSVLVGPVRLPAYLARPELARLAADGEIELDSGHRWLGSFEENFLRATSLGIARRLGSTQVVAHPSKAPFPIEYTVRLHVDDLIVDADGAMRVQIRWALVGPAGRGTGPLEGPAARLFTLEELRSGVGASPEARVRTYEAVLDELATRIAAEIVEVEAGR